MKPLLPQFSPKIQFCVGNYIIHVIYQVQGKLFDPVIKRRDMNLNYEENKCTPKSLISRSKFSHSMEGHDLQTLFRLSDDFHAESANRNVSFLALNRPV